ncbi:MAG: TonB-dependent receptor, partial [Bacteroidetes bacterium]|nr:TonB-dependent receptor [Bacteroidota bacterium]
DLDQVIGETYEFEDETGAHLVINEREATTSRWGNAGFSLKWARVWSDRFYTTLLLASSEYSNRHRYSYDLVTPDDTLYSFFGNEQNTVNDATFRLDHEWHLSNIHKVEFGAWFSTTEVNYLYEFVQTAADTIDAFDERAEGELSAFYLQDEWSPMPRLTLTLGARATYFGPTDETYLEPRFSFSYALGPNVRLKGAWGHFRQLINRVVNDEALAGTRDFWLLSDQELKPSFAEHGILGVSYENERYLLDVEGYHKNLDGVTEFSQRFTDDPKGLLFTGDGTARGLEILAQRKTGRLQGWLSYTLSKVEYEFDKLNGGAPFPANQDRRHAFTVVGDLKAGPWTVSASWTWASGRPYTEPESRYTIVGVDGTRYQGVRIGPKNTRRLPVYHRLDASLGRQLRAGPMNLDLKLSLFNVYDRQNVWYRQYRLDTRPIRVRDVMMLGFTPMVSVKATLD